MTERRGPTQAEMLRKLIEDGNVRITDGQFEEDIDTREGSMYSDHVHAMMMAHRTPPNIMGEPPKVSGPDDPRLHAWLKDQAMAQGRWRRADPPLLPEATKTCPVCERPHYSSDDYPQGGHFCGGDYCVRDGVVVMLEPGEAVLTQEEQRAIIGVDLAHPVKPEPVKPMTEPERIEKPKPKGWLRRLWDDAINAR